ncbi:MAG: nuclear transport factor 2 family protein [Candidatus Brocadiales bacterium]|nr:nuclear transport factor 2 family protein [Candidatus Bathyanammoxibius sp.]
MRNPVIFLVILASLGLVACEQKVDVAAEEEAIKAVNQKQLDAVCSADYEGEAAVWAQEPYIVIRKSGRKIVGWDSLSVWYKETFEKNRELVQNEPDKYRIDECSGSNYDIHLNGNAAYIHYDEHAEGIWEGEEFSNDSKVAKYLEKIDGEWKIVAVF